MMLNEYSYRIQSEPIIIVVLAVLYAVKVKPLVWAVRDKSSHQSFVTLFLLSMVAHFEVEDRQFEVRGERREWG